jgi:hypothetical protein
VTGRIFFEEVIRENLDIGRPKQVQLIFDRWVTRSTPGLFRTRVITDGVIPSLHVDYKGTRIKQYHKEGRALRTETTINNANDFYIGKRPHNLPALRRIGFQANRRLLEVQKITHDCIMAEETFQQINRRVRSNRNAPRPCDSVIPRCKPSGAPCWCSPGCQRASLTEISASLSHLSWAEQFTGLPAAK